jgi:hypothetical protein
MPNAHTNFLPHLSGEGRQVHFCRRAHPSQPIVHGWVLHHPRLLLHSRHVGRRTKHRGCVVQARRELQKAARCMQLDVGVSALLRPPTPLLEAGTGDQSCGQRNPVEAKSHAPSCIAWGVRVCTSSQLDLRRTASPTYNRNHRPGFYHRKAKPPCLRGTLSMAAWSERC